MTGQEAFLADHCPLNGRYFEPCHLSLSRILGISLDRTNADRLFVDGNFKRKFVYNFQDVHPLVKVKFKDFSRTFKAHFQ